ncbi:Homogentisate phytyltransferase 2 [Morus notabilis]|uniref:Homogentisate phytyltransferase 2 n=1 Tax=Morus notabilis TaxID=981085 RepID=W9R4D7_9ROSA|nr:Homogentisate phytyltransferase 2 [Morus notabilis]
MLINQGFDQASETGQWPKQDFSQAQYSASSDSALAKTSRFGSACYKFLRPYAVQQAIVSAIWRAPFTMSVFYTLPELPLDFPFGGGIPPIVFITTFVTLFFVVISITKDLTDVEGDMKHNIQTFAAIFGLRKIAFFCTGILLVNYMGAIVAAIYLPQFLYPQFTLTKYGTIIDLLM